MKLPESPVFCAGRARLLAEPLRGTASRVDIWLVLQQESPWTADVLDEPRLPLEVRAYFDLVQRHLPRARLILIKNGQRGYRGPRSFFVGLSDPVAPRLYEFSLDEPEDVLRINLVDLLLTPSAFAQHRVTTPIYLVCTHGRHDRCCARWGYPLYLDAEKRLGERAWQCSHIGGDRFAGNLVVLPHGLYYGHLESSDLDPLLARQVEDRPFQPRCRGRSCYEMPVQAAEQHLWAANPASRFDSFILESERRLSGERWRVILREKAGSRRIQVDLKREELGPTRMATCSAVRATHPHTYAVMGEIELADGPPECGYLKSYGDYEVRPARLEDYSFIYGLRARSRRTPPGVPMRPLRIDVSRYKLIHKNEQPLGTLRLLLRQRELRASALHFAGSPAEQGVGWQVARDLLTAAEAHQLPLRLQLEADDPRAAAFFALGFQSTEMAEHGPVLRFDPVARPR